MPRAEPSTAEVEKKARFFVSRGLSLVHSGILKNERKRAVLENLI
jgi:hypothetical protein